MAIELRKSATDSTIPGHGVHQGPSNVSRNGAAVHRPGNQSLRRRVGRGRDLSAHELFKKAGDLGLLGLSYPEEYGGAGADYWYNMAMAEEIARVKCGGDSHGHGRANRHGHAGAQSVRIARAEEEVSRAGHPRRRRVFGGRDRSQRRDRTWPRSAPRPSATAIDYVINGSKMYITNGVQADWICVLARTSPGTTYKGMSLIIVPTDTPGFSVSKKLKKMGNWASDTAELVFDNVPRAGDQSHRRGGAGLHLSDAAVPERATGQRLGSRGRRRKDPHA